MNSAIRYRKNFSSGNTTVRAFRESVEVYLHGNNIASLDTATHALTIFDGGWQSNTTKSRLNALCEYFCVDGEGVFQKDFAWYVRKFVGAINGQSKFVTETFQSGYVFA